MARRDAISVNIKGGESLERIIEQAGEELEAVVIQATKQSAHKAGIKTKQKLSKANLGGRKYNKGWRTRTDETGIIVYQDKQPTLTWLLENGHDIIVGGKKVGRTSPKPHIKPAEEYGAELFEEGIIEELSRRFGA